MGHAADSWGWDSSSATSSSLDAQRLQGRSPVLMSGPPAHSTVSELDFVGDLVSEAGPSPPHLNHPLNHSLIQPLPPPHRKANHPQS